MAQPGIMAMSARSAESDLGPFACALQQCTTVVYEQATWRMV
jgi:hypothetical protein